MLCGICKLNLPASWKTTFAAMAVTCFFGLLHLCEVMWSLHNIKADDVHFYVWDYNSDFSAKAGNKSFITICFWTCKTDQDRSHKLWTWLAREKEPTLCPVRANLKYLKIWPQNSEHYFVALNRRPITRDAFVKTLNVEIMQVLGKLQFYSSHSLQIGGSVHLYMSGWSLPQIMDKGHWKSEYVAKHYCLNKCSSLVSQKFTFSAF